ncbi:MAG: hypothetical protein V8T01_01680 [Oscillospiraceae bacterium]
MLKFVEREDLIDEATTAFSMADSSPAASITASKPCPSEWVNT